MEELDEEAAETDRDGGTAEAEKATETGRDSEAARHAPTDDTHTGERPLPPWFTEGSYAFATDGSKKMPLRLDETHLTERFIRGSGPGGQAINRLAPNVELVHIPTGERVTCQATRSRQLNREFARRIMSQRLEHLVKQAWHVPLGEANRTGARSVLQSRWDKERRRKHNRRKKQRKRASSTP